MTGHLSPLLAEFPDPGGEVRGGIAISSAARAAPDEPYTKETGAPDADPRGGIRGFVAHVSDITPHKRAEQGLRDSEETAARGRPPQGRVPGDAGPRAVQSAGPAPQRLIGDLLDVSRINSGRLELKRERLDLREMLAEGARASRPCLEERGHRFHLHLPAEPVWLDGDPMRLTQVFGRGLAVTTGRRAPRRILVEDDNRDAGLDAHLVKPVDPAALFELMAPLAITRV